jgi:hypothetical protein
LNASACIVGTKIESWMHCSFMQLHTEGKWRRTLNC